MCVGTRTRMLRLESGPILCDLMVEFKGASRKRGRNEVEKGHAGNHTLYYKRLIFYSKSQ